MRRARAVFVVLAGVGALGGVAGCGPDLPERLWRSEHVRYFSREGDTAVCPAILDQFEEHGAVIADALGIGRTLVSYYKFDGLSDFNENSECGEVAGACAQNATARSPLDFDRHELIHTYLAQYGRPPWLLTEGAAVALSCQRYPRPTGSWRDAFAAPHPSQEQYAAGGWLVGYLLRMFRATWFVNLYGRVSAGATADELARIFEEIYGLPLDGVWSAATATPMAPMHCPWECGRPELPADGQPRTLEPVCGSGSLQLSVNLPTGGITRWRIEGAGRYRLRSCDGNEEPSGPFSSGDGAGVLVAPLLAGRYFLEAVVERGGRPALSAGLDADGVAVSFACASAPALPDDIATLSRLAIFYPGSEASRFTGFASASDRLGQVAVRSEDPDASAALCASCDAQTCSTISGDQSTSGPIGPGHVVDVSPGPALTVHISWPPP